MIRVALIGAGTSGLFFSRLLHDLDPKIQIDIFDHSKSLGLKFLVAGKSGLNITTNVLPKDLPNFYQANQKIKDCLKEFDNDFFQKWLNSKTIQTYEGSSKKVFPKSLKAKEILELLKPNHPSVCYYFDTNILDINDMTLKTSRFTKQYDYIVFATGGGSWKRTGSDGRWCDLLKRKKIKINPFTATNCGVMLSPQYRDFLKDHHLRPIKYINVYTDKFGKVSGDLMIKEEGLEGAPIYFKTQEKILGPLYLDLCPDLSVEQIEKRLVGKKSVSTKLKSFLDAEKRALLFCSLTKDEFLDVKTLASMIKKCPVFTERLFDIEESISTCGGIDLEEISENFELKKMKNVFCIGEMLDFNAPTGGFLIQACFSQASMVAKNIKGRI